MLTLEVNGQFVTWPEQFAIYMMRCYRNGGIPFVVHRNCIHSGRNAVVEKRAQVSAQGRTGAPEYACEYPWAIEVTAK